MSFLAHCSNLAYEPMEDIKRSIISEGFPNVEFLYDKKTDTELFIASNDKAIIVAFRGTELAIKDVLTDIKIRRVDWPNNSKGGSVQNGLYSALKSIYPELTKTIREFRKNKQSLWFTGHSLGGALACLAAGTYRLQSWQSVNGVYTFGQPRVGNRKFVTNYNKHLKDITFRMVNNNDIVPRMPSTISGFSHAGTLKYFDSEGQLMADKDMGWWSVFKDRTRANFRALFGLKLDPLADHLMNAYESLARKNLANGTALNEPQELFSMLQNTE